MRFAIGMRVRLTDKAVEAGLQGRARNRYGKVRSISHSGRCLWVKRTGIKGYQEPWDSSWWKPSPAPQDGREAKE